MMEETTEDKWAQLAAAIGKANAGLESVKGKPALEALRSALIKAYDNAKPTLIDRLAPEYVLTRGKADGRTLEVLRLSDPRLNFALSKLIDFVSYVEVSDQHDEKNYYLELAKRFDQARLALEDLLNRLERAQGPHSLRYRLALLAAAEIADQQIERRLDPDAADAVWTSPNALMVEHIDKVNKNLGELSNFLNREPEHVVWDRVNKHAQYFAHDATGIGNLLFRNLFVILGITITGIAFYWFAPLVFANVSADPVYLLLATLAVSILFYSLARRSRGSEIGQARRKLRYDILHLLVEGIDNKVDRIGDVDLLDCMTLRLRLANDGSAKTEERKGPVLRDRDAGWFAGLKAGIIGIARPVFDFKPSQLILGVIAGLLIFLLPLLMNNTSMFANPSMTWPLQDLLGHRSATVVAIAGNGPACKVASGYVVAQDKDRIVLRSAAGTTLIPNSGLTVVRYGRDATAVSGGTATVDEEFGALLPCARVQEPVSTPAPQVVADVIVPVMVPLEVSLPVTPAVAEAPSTTFALNSYLMADNTVAELSYPAPEFRHVVLPVFDTDVKGFSSGSSDALYQDGHKSQPKLNAMLSSLKDTLYRRLSWGCNIAIDVRGYASLKQFEGHWRSETELANWILAEGRRQAVLDELGFVKGADGKWREGRPAAGNLELLPGDPDPKPPADLVPRSGLRFASYQSMQTDLGLWYEQPEVSGKATDEVLARSAVISLSQADLSSCRKTPLQP